MDLFLGFGEENKLMAILSKHTKFHFSAGLKYYIIGGAILGIFLGIVVVSFIVLCWCCRLQKPKEDLTELKTLESRDSTRPKHPVLAGNFSQKEQFYLIRSYYIKTKNKKKQNNKTKQQQKI